MFGLDDIAAAAGFSTPTDGGSVGPGGAAGTSSNAQASVGGGIISGGGAYSVPPGFFLAPGGGQVNGVPSSGRSTDMTPIYVGVLALGAAVGLYLIFKR